MIASANSSNKEDKMKARSNKWIVIWNIVLTVALLISFAASAALVQAAADPPVQVFTAPLNDIGLDYGNVGNKNVSSTTFTPVAFVPITVSTDRYHSCVAIASVGLNWNSQGKYTIGIGYDDTTNIMPYSKRQFEFISQVGINNEDFQEVSSVVARTDVKGTHTFYLLAKKNSDTSSYLVIDRGVVTVICMHGKI
jgi:hypothetical protein